MYTHKELRTSLSVYCDGVDSQHATRVAESRESSIESSGKKGEKYPSFSRNKVDTVIMQDGDDTQPDDKTIGDAKVYKNLEYWMTDLPPELKTLPINHLAIPGSHDTMTYTITRRGKVGPDGPNILRYLGCFSVVLKPIIYNWSITQHDDVRAQLNGGIRYLDLRVSRKNDTNEIFFLHGLYGAEIDKPLRDVADWLSSHPGEILILDFQHFYKFDEALHQTLIGIIENIFKDKLCPVYPNFNHISLQWMALEKYQVFLIYRNISALSKNNLWFSSLWTTPWADTVDPKYLVKFLNEKLEFRNPKTGFVSQCLLTPDSYYIAKHPFGNLEKDLVGVCRNNILPWINEKSPGGDGLNIVISDFVSYNDFIFSKTVIQRNVELLKTSKKSPSAKYIEVKPKS